MALSASGAISADDIRTEYGLSGAVSFGDLYRGGTHVRAKAANNNGVNLASSVPTSGAITFGNFRGTAKGFRYTFTAGATDQDASALFGSDYGVNYPKEIVINSGVELGATSTSQEALEIDSGGAGTITITNNGTLSGAGGAAGADGGDAFEAAVTCTFINNGTVRAGGGGGGAGGAGGNGSYSQTNYYYNPVASSSGYYWSYNGSGVIVMRAGSNYTAVAGYWWQTSYGSYVRGTLQSGSGTSSGASNYQIGIVSNVSTSGGAGGSGAVGAGYGQSAGTGSAGSAGGTNAGTGGTGGNGGGFGAAGSTGATGANGNSTNGSAGSAGGAAGKYLRGSSFVTFTNNGTAQGGTA